MNIRTATDIDRAIRAAEDMHDLHAGQTGTRRAPRVPNYDQPADQPVVEFDGEDGDRPLLDSIDPRRCMRWLFDDIPKEVLAVWAVERFCTEPRFAEDVLLSEWASAYMAGLVTAPLTPRALQAYATQCHQDGIDEADCI